MRCRRYGERWYGPKAVVAATKDACESAIAAGVVAKAHPYYVPKMLIVSTISNDKRRNP